MQASSLKALFTDDEGVSPVIGVILMVAVTVILAAVIASFVMNMGGSLSESAPQANFDFDYDADAGNLTVTHDSGDSFTGDNTQSLNVQVADSDNMWADADGDFPVTAGDSKTISSVNSGDEVRVIWTSNDGESSQTVGQYTV
ncbi:type IV pilin N-terminal domain-containing protein [Salinibaculum rarum]|uniref:type IV pilin N-terminal domain-containing protein n=1 Tax=Salinibaculum rarum TaxID=3058903 RepID=UPI00265FA4A6|nr:type IV pilin N-terminal domain-containing protein [Salinibaculum sp. KK48]